MDVNGTCGDLGTLKVAILKELSRDEKITLNLSKGKFDFFSLIYSQYHL
jgi:hypothetical protein